jgi:dTDP-4-amino-4,6-dideoxygalactose transaminase
MWARGRFDISWSDLAFGLLRCAWPGDRDRLQRRLERLWSPAGDALACYSVRSAFDLLLRSLALPPGSEVLFSALNVGGMVRVVERLGLVPVPVDLDLAHLAPRLDRLERAITARSRVLVVAHLFGARIDLDPLLEIARRRGLFVVEDCAQAFEGVGDTGHPRADASLFSFGPLKTATALGGALARVADSELRERMRRAQAGYPLQTRGSYFSRVVRFIGLKALTYRSSSAALFLLTRLARADLDRHLEQAARSLTREKDASRPGRPSHKLQRRPSAPMLALLERRLRRASERNVAARCPRPATAPTSIRWSRASSSRRSSSSPAMRRWESAHSSARPPCCATRPVLSRRTPSALHAASRGASHRRGGAGSRASASG